MPYKKGGEAEQRARIRRTANRRISMFERDIKRSTSEHERNIYKDQIDKLREFISKTYVRNPYTHKATGYEHDELRLAAQNLTRINEATKRGTSATARKNFITQQELNNAESYDYREKKRPATKYTSQEVSIFYKATEKAWNTREFSMNSTLNKNKLILDYYHGMKQFKGATLEELVDTVLANNQKAVEKAHSYRETVESEEDLQPESAEEQLPGSADWAADVVSLSQIDALKSYLVEEL